MGDTFTASSLAARADDTATWYRAQGRETKANLWARQAASFRALAADTGPDTATALRLLDDLWLATVLSGQAPSADAVAATQELVDSTDNQARDLLTDARKPSVRYTRA
jgi:hypothetical protein